MPHPSEFPEPYRAFATLLIDRPDAPVELLRLFLALGKKADRTARTALLDLLAEGWPDHPIIRAATSQYRLERVHSYHRPMVLDAKRNDAYAAAIAASIRPGMRVLEIGSGSGILSMLAARAGAERVFTIEARPVMAAIARANIARNGLAHRIEVIEGMSTDPVVRERIPTDCDALMHELFDARLLGDGVLGFIADARESFLRPEAILLPEQAMLLGHIEGTDRRDPAGRFGDVCGFDLSALDRIREVSRFIREQDIPTLQPLSAPFTIAEFDLREGDDRTRTEKEIQVETWAAGTAHGLVQWIGFRFPDGTSYSNPPGQPSHWLPVFHEFPEPRATAPDERRRLVLHQLGVYLGFELF